MCRRASNNGCKTATLILKGILQLLRSVDRCAAAVSRLEMNSCGVDGTYHVNVTRGDGRYCDATVSDVDDASCTSTSTMTLTLRQCRSRRSVLGQFLRFQFGPVCIRKDLRSVQLSYIRRITAKAVIYRQKTYCLHRLPHFILCSWFLLANSVYHKNYFTFYLRYLGNFVHGVDTVPHFVGHMPATIRDVWTCALNYFSSLLFFFFFFF